MSLKKFILGFILGAAVVAVALMAYNYACLYWRPYHNYPPLNTSISLDSTNLPILMINTNGTSLRRKDYKTVEMVIIDNGEGKLNYADTLRWKKQKVDYRGEIAIRYRGNSSFNRSEKKSYAIRPLGPNGKKKKTSLLGMKKSKKWALQAYHTDRSLIRNSLMYELARPNFDYVPHSKHCEVIIDGAYYGVFVLSEQNTLDRLDIKKAKGSDTDITGGYMIQFEAVSQISQDAHPSKYWNVQYIYEEPDEKITKEQKAYVDKLIDSMEDAFYKKDFATISKLVDVESLINYQLAVELSHNMDGYVRSVYLYKDKDKNDPRFKILLWDFDLTFGNSNYRDGWRYDTYRLYDDSLRVKLKGQYDEHHFLWGRLMEIPEYTGMLKAAWRKYRQENYSDEHIFHVLDSLSSTLSAVNAVERNAMSWQVFYDDASSIKTPNYIWPNKYISSTYDDEINYLRDWLEERLKWLDSHLLD